MFRRQLTLALAIVMCLSAASELFAQNASSKARADKLIAVLKSNAPQKDKADACRNLATIGDPRAIPVLTGMLADEKLSHMARYALEPLADASVDAALREAMGKLKGRLRIGVIGSIGMRRDTKAVGALTKLLKGPDTGAASAAAAALGRIATPSAISALAEFRKSAPKELRAPAADASLAVAERLIRQKQTKGAIAIYGELRDKAWPPHVRLGAFAGLLDNEPDKALGRITEALGGKDKALRAVAISRIASLKGPGVSKRFAEKLPMRPTDAQAPLIDALAALGDPAAGPAVRKATGHADAGVRIAAIKALGVLGDADCVGFLCTTMSEGKSDPEKRAAEASLRAMGAKGVDAALIKRMEAAKADARTPLIAILIDRKSVAAVPALIKQVATKDQGVSLAAIRGLGKLASPKELPAIVQLLLKIGDDTVRREAELAVIAVSRRITNANARADVVLAALKSASSSKAKRSLLAVLGGIGNAKAFPVVEAAVKDKNSEICDAAVRALVVWPDGRATGALLGVYRTTKDKTHRVLALRAIVRLLGISKQPVAKRLAIYSDLIKGTQSAEDRKLLLAGLGEIADPAALKTIEPFLKDAVVQKEAEFAYLKVAKSIMGSARAESKAAAQKLAKEAKNAAVRKQAAGIVRRL